MVLLDVNLLVALLDGNHIFNPPAQRWFLGLEEPWATCPITELGAMRLLMMPQLGSIAPAEVSTALEGLKEARPWVWMTDDISPLDRQKFLLDELRGSKATTDTYLVGLCQTHGARLATFDRRMRADAVASASDEIIERL